MTRLMVLGLLTHGPMSGYEMQQALQQSQADKWAGILPGSIYHALKKLDQEGLVALDTVTQTGNRSKATYRITDEGHAEFRKLLAESLRQSSVVYPTALYTAMSFIDVLPLDEALSSLDGQIVELEAELASMKAGQEAKEQVMKLPAHIVLVFENLYGQIGLQLDFLRRLRLMLGGEQGNHLPNGGTQT